MRILFHSNQLSIRGTEVALYDYAHYNETFLGNESLIAYDRSNRENDPAVIARFQRRFPVYGYSTFTEMERQAEMNRCDKAYFIKAGSKDGKVSSAVPNLIHAVFPAPPSEEHGSIYAFISEWLSRAVSGGRVPYVPHMIDLPQRDDDLRSSLNIPPSALVIGSYGGFTSFDVPFVPGVVFAALERRRDLVFLFMNYPRSMAHERAIYLAPTPDREFKVRFINSCDAMLHARMLGESFGLACGEFSTRNKPVLTFGGSPHRSHIELLGEKAVLYNSDRELFDVLMRFDRDRARADIWDCYSARFSPQPVMRKFNEVFLERPLV